MKNFEKKLFLKFELKIFVFWILKKVGHRKWKILKKKLIFKFGLKYVTKIWNEKIEFFIFLIWNFSFLKFEMKISVQFILKIGHITKWKWKKQLKWRNHIFRLCHKDKTSNNTPIPPMYTTLHHMCKLWWYTINLIRRILSYWSFSNSDIGWYGPP
jgi:hypothetical protein